MDLNDALLGSGLGWLFALALCQIFRLLRRDLPKPVAVVGSVAASFWLLISLIFLFGAISRVSQRWDASLQVSVFPLAAFCAAPLLVCAGIAALQRGFYALPAQTRFGVLAAEALLAAVLLFPQNGMASLVHALFPVPAHADAVYRCVCVALPLSLMVEEIAGPLRRGGETVTG